MAITNRQIKVNLFLVSISFLLNFVAFGTLQGLQSSLNNEAGAYSLSALYCAFVISSLFLPTISMEFLRNRKSMGVAIMCYIVYTLANCYPRPYTLIPAAVILGSGSSLLWPASRVYVSDLASAYAKQTQSDESKITSHFLGIFQSFTCLATLIGNSVSSAVIQIFGMQNDGGNDTRITSTDLEVVTNTAISAETSSAGTMMLRCGMHNCDAYENSTIFQESTGSNVNTIVLIAMFGGFIFVQIAASLIMFLFVDDAPKVREDDWSVKKDKMAEQDVSTSEKSGLQNQTEKFEIDDAESEEQLTRSQRVLKQTLATGRFIITNHSARMLIPLTFNTGMLLGFVFGQLTKYWTTCAIGIEYVGYTICAFGLGSTIGPYTTGLLTQRIGRWIVMVVTGLGDIAISVYLLLWEPEIDNETWLFLFIFFVFGIIQSVQKTLLLTVYAIFFIADREASCASFCIWESMGSAVAFAISSHACNRPYVLSLLVLQGVGCTLYLANERKYTKNQKRRRDLIT